MAGNKRRVTRSKRRVTGNEWRRVTGSEWRVTYEAAFAESSCDVALAATLACHLVTALVVVGARCATLASCQEPTNDAIQSWSIVDDSTYIHAYHLNAKDT